MTQNTNHKNRLINWTALTLRTVFLKNTIKRIQKVNYRVGENIFKDLNKND